MDVGRDYLKFLIYFSRKRFDPIGTFFDHGYQAIFDDKTVLIINKGSEKITMRGKRHPLLNLYMLNLTQRNKLMMEFQTPEEYFAGSVYE